MQIKCLLPIILFCFSCSTEKQSIRDNSSTASIDFQGKKSSSDMQVNKNGRKHQLSALKVMERDFNFVHHFYVNSDLLVEEKIKEMLVSSLDLVELQVDEAKFSIQKKQIVATVGVRSQSFIVAPLNNIQGLLETIKPIAKFLDETLSEDVDRAQVEYLLINGALSALDPHSILLPPIQAAEMEVDNQGEFGGLGIEINISDGQLTVKQPIEGTPASKVGLKADDKIVKIEDASTINMDLMEAVSMLRGEVGTDVKIMVMRKGWVSPKPFVITRGRIKIDPVKGELLSNDIAYIRIQSFHQNVARDMEKLLENYENQSTEGLNALILDLRSNPGGYLNQAIKVSDKFLRNGVIVATVEGASKEREESHARSVNTISDIPIIVLVNGSSASASEIVAGALRNQGRGVIVGERTFGKGSVQHLYENPDESRLKLTVAQYLTPGDQSIQSIGIPPDILLQPSIIRMETEETDEMISLYWREWLKREADLDHHLEYETLMNGETRFKVRYLLEERETGSKIDPKEDWDVQFAHSILLNTQGADRSSVLLAAKNVVESSEIAEQEKIQKAFLEHNIDWTEGSNSEKVNLDVDLDFGSDQKLIAGEKESITLNVTNLGEQPLHQISAYITSDNPSLDHREFYLGMLPVQGESTQTVDIMLPRGYGSEKGDVTIHVRDSYKELYTKNIQYETQGHEKPLFSCEITIDDSNSENTKGDGDGIPEVGETIALSFALKNIGDGEAVHPYIRLKNKSRRSVDLVKGTLELGESLKDGVSCEPDSVECYRYLKAGEQQTDILYLELREEPKESWDLEVLIGSNLSYDYNTSVLGGFSDYFQMKYRLSLQPTKAFEKVTLQQPKIIIERSVQNGDIAEITGYVEDEGGIKDILIFQGEEKVYYRGEAGATGKLPFAIEHKLSTGGNPFYILSKDNDGLTSSFYINLWK
jgi:carboxyl-terminal processing protease